MPEAGSISQEIGNAGTLTSAIAEAPLISETRTEARLLTEDIGFGRSRAREINDQYDELHARSHLIEWQTRTTERGKSSPLDLLTQIADLGFSWRDVARALDVSVPSLQKWRRGAGVTGENRRRVAAFIAGCDIVAEDYAVQEVASWFEMPISSQAPISPLDLWQNERPDLVFDYASGHVDSEQILTIFDPDWRETYRSDFEAYDASDGLKSIRPKRA